MNNTVLIVDSGEGSLLVLRNALRKKGFSIVVARSGEVGLWKAMTELPAAVILASRLPHMNRWEVCEEIKSNAETSHIPVIVMTGQTDVEEHARAFLARCDAYIPETEGCRQCVDTVKKFTGASFKPS